MMLRVFYRTSHSLICLHIAAQGFNNNLAEIVELHFVVE